MTEQILLDPTTLTGGARTQIDITPWIKGDGIDWGDSEIEAYMSQQTVGELPIGFRLPNRKIVIPFMLRNRNGQSFSSIRSSIQAKAAIFQQEGGWLGRVINGTGTWVDIVKATLHLGGSSMAAIGRFDDAAVLQLEAKPDFYANPVVLDMITSTGVLTTLLKVSSTATVIQGHYPGRISMLVSDTSGQDRHGLLWGWRSRYYSNLSSAALSIEAETMSLPAGATIQTRSGASGGGSNNVVQITPTSSWADALITGSLTHRGQYRVWARIYSTTTSTNLRLLWSVGELATPVVNTTVPIPLANNFALVDLGEIRLDINPFGAHRWTGHFQCKGSGTLQIDQILFQPVAEGAGQLIGYTAPGNLQPGQIAPAVIKANRDALISTDGMFNLTSDAASYMPMSEVYGTLPRVPPGLEGRNAELFMYVTRGDFHTQPDVGGPSDSISITSNYRPSYLICP